MAGFRRRRRVLPGFGVTLGSTVLFVSLAILLPLGALFLKAAGLTFEEYWEYVTDPRAIATYRVVLICAVIATIIDVILGVLLAWVLVRYEFPGRRILDSVVDLPFALPTAVAGIALAALTAPASPIGKFFGLFDIQIAYAFPGIIVAMTFTSFPFVVRTVQPVLEDFDPTIEEAAESLGAGPFLTFRRVIFPDILPAVLSGMTVAFVRSLGEFGAVVFMAGNRPFQTEITSLLIYIRVDEYDYPGAAALATVVLLFALVLLLAMNLVQAVLYRRLHG